ncbi:12108_t:CDS:2, partial [Racocetra fulgida]
EEDPPIIKIWDLDKQDKSKGTPTCQRTIKVNHGGKPFPVSALAVLENLGQIAVGLANGVVVLIKGAALGCAVMSDTTHEMVVAKDEFLDAQRIHNLVNYLQELHNHGFANADHTTLLLNCYTKLKDVARLDQFIKTDNDELKFDVETAIKIEDVKDFENALEYIRKLGSNEANRNLQKYGKILLNHLPHPTTQLLIDLCTGDLFLTAQRSRFSTPRKHETLNVPRTVSNRPASVGSIDVDDVVSKDSIENNDYEAEEKKAVWNTLLELYLSEAYLPPVVSGKDSKGRKYGAPGNFAVSTETERVKEKLLRKDKALQLLKNQDVSYDSNQALVLCYLAQFDEGIVYLYEKMKMYEEILRFYMAKDDTDKVILPHDQSLYLLALAYFSSSPTTLSTSTSELLQILDHIDSHNLLPPLQVIQALSRNSIATLGMIKGYMGKRIESEKKETQVNKKKIQDYREETEKKKKEIEELKT